MRAGLGYDIHRLTEGRKLVLGGVIIPFEKGLLGHSDADVVLHALCDALLGAAGLGDIGQHFPDTEPRFKDISSMKLLEKTFQLVRTNGFRVNNVDATILAEAPRLDRHRAAIQSNIAGVLKLEPGDVNIKATTMEGLDAIGKGEAIAAMCVVTLVEK
jgi:2-C-methyl-D-erythritol 2,4-cyclodiphosphate synthase